MDEEKEQEADIMDLFMNHYDKSNAERIRYLSSYWIKKRSLLGLAVAGPPSNADVLCRHGLLLRRCRQRMLGVEGIDLGTDSHFSFPVVPKGKARIRTQMSAALTEDEIDFAIKAFGNVKAKLGL